MTDIEQSIHDKKAEIKKANRELSILQEELKKKYEPVTLKLERIDFYYNNPQLIQLSVSLNKPYQADMYFYFKRAIESLSDKPKEPESYVNWDKIDVVYGDWGTIDRNGDVCISRTKPEIGWCRHSNVIFLNEQLNDAIIRDSLPAWDKSLIHRPE